MPPPAHVDDYDSDTSAVIPGTRREAGNHGPPSKPLMQHMRKQGRDAASDSGYSSHAPSSTHSQPALTTQHLRQISQPANQNTIGRRESQRGQQRPSRSPSVSKCTDPRCGDPTCASSQDPQLKYTLPHRPQPQRSQTSQYPVQEPGSSLPKNQAPNYQQPLQPAGQPASSYYQYPTEPRPRAPSTTQSRPTSWAPGAHPHVNYYQPGIAVPQGGYAPGLPPSPSTYNRYPAGGDWQNMPPPQMVSGSPRDPYGAYMPSQPMIIPSNGQTHQPAPYSARQVNPAISGQDMSIPATGYQQPTISARRSSGIPSSMPGSFPGETQAVESLSESSSESSDSEDDHERQRYKQPRRREHSRHREQERERERTRRALEDRDRKLMPPPPRDRERDRERRPTLIHTRTTPVESRHRSREAPRRAPYSDPDLLTSEYLDSDRTARPNMSKRLTYSNSRELRRPSITQHESSTRDRASSLLHPSQPTTQYVVEDANGRKRYYDTRAEAEYKASRLNQQQREDDIEAYIADKRGNPHPATLTTGDVKRAQQHPQARKASSHTSGSSRKSTGSSRISTSETIQIKRGDSVYTIPADRTVAITTKEGETMTIGPGSPPREKSYHGSSSGSRTGRSRNGSEYGGRSRRRDTITEEHDGYESGH